MLFHIMQGLLCNTIKHAVSFQVVTAEFLTQAIQLSIVVVYAPTDQSIVELKEHSY